MRGAPDMDPLAELVLMICEDNHGVVKGWQVASRLLKEAIQTRHQSQLEVNSLLSARVRRLEDEVSELRHALLTKGDSHGSR